MFGEANQAQFKCPGPAHGEAPGWRRHGLSPCRFPGAICAYPEPQYTTPSAMDGTSITQPALSKLQRIFPVLAFQGVNQSRVQPPHTCLRSPPPRHPYRIAPFVGSAVWQAIRPVRALWDPT